MANVYTISPYPNWEMALYLKQHWDQQPTRIQATPDESVWKITMEKPLSDDDVAAANAAGFCVDFAKPEYEA